MSYRLTNLRPKQTFLSCYTDDVSGPIIYNVSFHIFHFQMMDCSVFTIRAITLVRLIQSLQFPLNAKRQAKELQHPFSKFKV